MGSGCRRAPEFTTAGLRKLCGASRPHVDTQRSTERISRLQLTAKRQTGAGRTPAAGQTRPGDRPSLVANLAPRQRRLPPPRDADGACRERPGDAVGPGAGLVPDGLECSVQRCPTSLQPRPRTRERVKTEPGTTHRLSQLSTYGFSTTREMAGRTSPVSLRRGRLAGQPDEQASPLTHQPGRRHHRADHRVASLGAGGR